MQLRGLAPRWQWRTRGRAGGAARGGVNADPLYIIAHADGSLLFGAITLGLIGADRAYPDLDAFSLFNPPGLAIANNDAVDGYGCGVGVAAQLFGTAAEYCNYPTSQALAAAPQIQSIVPNANLTQGAVPTAPGFIYNAIDDEIMLIPQVDALVDHWSAAGDKVYDDGSSFGEHIIGIWVYNPLALLYLDSRFAGFPAPNTCASAPPTISALTASAAAPLCAELPARSRAARREIGRLCAGAYGSNLSCGTLVRTMFWRAPHRQSGHAPRMGGSIGAGVMLHRSASPTCAGAQARLAQ